MGTASPPTCPYCNQPNLEVERLVWPGHTEPGGYRVYCDTVGCEATWPWDQDLAGAWKFLDRVQRVDDDGWKGHHRMLLREMAERERG